MLDNVSQLAIVVLGPLAILLVAKKSRWGFIVGFVSQPFWILTSIINQQWGVFVVSLFYAFFWSIGIYEWFLKTEKKKKVKEKKLKKSDSNKSKKGNRVLRKKTKKNSSAKQKSNEKKSKK